LNEQYNHKDIQMRRKRIYLVGFMGAGKSTLGRQLSKELKWRFYDTDEILANNYGAIGEIFENQGEDYFREIEGKLLRSLLTPPFIMATGGGTACFSDNMDFMLEHGTVVFLKISKELFLYRLKKDPAIIQRPLLKKMKDEELIQLYENRLHHYQRAHITHDAMDQTDLLIERLNSDKVEY
jgi:shikimate kinase